MHFLPAFNLVKMINFNIPRASFFLKVFAGDSPVIYLGADKIFSRVIAL